MTREESRGASNALRLGMTERVVAVDPPKHVRGTTYVTTTHVREGVTGRFRQIDHYFDERRW